MQRIQLRAPLALFLSSISSVLLLGACSSTAPLARPALTGTAQLDGSPLIATQVDNSPRSHAQSNGGFGELKRIVFEASWTPRDGLDDDVYGLGFYNYRESGWGMGFQLQGTLRDTDPRVGAIFIPPTAELPRRKTEVTFDVVATRRISPTFGVFAGAGITSIEEYRRFLDNVGSDFFQRVDRDIEPNLTAGVHLWLIDGLTVSAQYDSVFEAATFALGWEF